MEVTPQFSAEPSVSVNWVDLKEGSFATKVARLRGTYTMTTRMYVSGIVQFNSTSTSLGSNLRFRWEYRPGSEVFVVKDDNRIAVQPVRLGPVQGGQWLVLDGLKSGDRVVVDGFQKFAAGDSVNARTISAEVPPEGPATTVSATR